ncbi:MAG TPA: hypothetical protein VGB19_14640 [Actinomycetota bacterium]
MEKLDSERRRSELSPAHPREPEESPFSGGRQQDLVLQRELADLALGLLQPAVLGGEGAGLQALQTPRHELIPPRRQAVGLHPELAGDLIEVLSAEQPHHGVRLASC